MSERENGTTVGILATFEPHQFVEEKGYGGSCGQAIWFVGKPIPCGLQENHLIHSKRINKEAA